MKFLPGLRSRLEDVVSTCTWMVVVACGSSVRFFSVLQGSYDVFGEQTFAIKITATIMIVVIPVYSLLTLPLLYYAVGKTSDLVLKPDLPRPKNLAMFLAILILTLCMMSYSVFYIIQGYAFSEKKEGNEFY